MVELRVFSKESGLLDRAVPDHCSHHHSLLYGAVHPGGLFSGPVPLPRQKGFHAFFPADQCVSKTGHLHF